MTADDYTKAMLASLIWRAASGISFPAMVAVGLCVRNQVKDGNWLPVIAGISSTMPAGKDCEDARDPRFQNVLTAVDGIFDGTRVDKWTNGGLYWTPVGEKFWWTSGVKERVATVAGLEIYR